MWMTEFAFDDKVHITAFMYMLINKQEIAASIRKSKFDGVTFGRFFCASKESEFKERTNARSVNP